MIRKKRNTKKQVIDLTGPMGNVFALMGIVHSAFGLESPDVAKMICRRMMSGDYEKALRVFDRCLGHRYILER